MPQWPIDFSKKIGVRRPVRDRLSHVHPEDAAIGQHDENGRDGDVLALHGHAVGECRMQVWVAEQREINRELFRRGDRFLLWVDTDGRKADTLGVQRGAQLCQLTSGGRTPISERITVARSRLHGGLIAAAGVCYGRAPMCATIQMLVLTAILLLPACGNISPPAEVQECSALDPDSPDKEEKPLRPMIPSQDPGIESLFCQKITCGNTTWSVNFKLPVPAATSGWVVQEISYDINVTGGTHLQGHFWEGFFIRKGDTRGVYYPDYDDTYKDTGENTHPDNSKGISTAIGKAKFYEGTLPADFICPNPAAASGTRRSTTTQPPFWDGTGTAHDLTVTWDCTGGADITTMLATPDPGGVCPQN